MKALLLGMMIALSAQHCQDDRDNTGRTIDEQGYVAEDVIRRGALERWEQFLTNSHKQLDKAEKEIAAAADRLDDRGTKNKLILEIEIINAEGMLERLCERLERGSRFEGIDLTDENISRMNHYMAGYREKEKDLRKAIDGLNGDRFRK